jgi:CTP synthase
MTQREKLTEMVELPRERASLVRRRAVPPRVQVHAWDGHPLFTSFIRAALGTSRPSAHTGNAAQLQAVRY